MTKVSVIIPAYNIVAKNPHAKTEQLLEEANEKYDV